MGNKKEVNTTAEVITNLRKAMGWTQLELSKRTGVEQSNINAIEHGRQNVGKHRAIVFAKIFDVHPAVIMFPDYIES
jgi:transcriptional regulator with XRE-family HTH domain